MGGAVTNEKTVEILAHRRGKGVQLFRLVGSPGATQDFCLAAKLLVQKGDGPAADHTVAVRGIDRLKRILPVPVATWIRITILFQPSPVVLASGKKRIRKPIDAVCI
jgi:hypothetical protein